MCCYQAVTDSRGEEISLAGRIVPVRSSLSLVYFCRTKEQADWREGKKGGAQSEVDIGLSPSEEMLPIAQVKYVCIEV